MSFYYKHHSDNQSEELKIHTSFPPHQSNYYYAASPDSPSTANTNNEQAALSYPSYPSATSSLLLQEQQLLLEEQALSPSLEEWMLIHQNQLQSHPPLTYNMPLLPPTATTETATSYSEASSLGIRTPDLALSDINYAASGGYTSFLRQQCHPQLSPVVVDDIQLIPSLSHQDHMMLLQKGYSDEEIVLSQHHQDNNHMQSFFFEQQQQQSTDSLTQLSREQLIERVVQLEMEKTTRRRRSSSAASSTQQSFYDDEANYEIAAITLCTNSTNKQQQEQQTKQQMHSCLWVPCTAQAPTLDRLMTHICESHIGSGKATYYCEWQDCARNKKPFMKRHKMHNHMRTHTGERPFVCTVIGCNKTFSRPDSLNTHIKTHSDIRPYLCSMPNCEKAYFHSRSLRKHIKSTHLNTKVSARRNTPSSVVQQHQQQQRTSIQQKSAAGYRHPPRLGGIKLEENPPIVSQQHQPGQQYFIA